MFLLVCGKQGSGTLEDVCVYVCLCVCGLNAHICVSVHMHAP